ncbi:MAG: hypothetical protein AAGE76_04460 [Pseudomonadota bacterium]
MTRKRKTETVRTGKAIACALDLSREGVTLFEPHSADTWAARHSVRLQLGQVSQQMAELRALAGPAGTPIQTEVWLPEEQMVLRRIATDGGLPSFDQVKAAFADTAPRGIADLEFDQDPQSDGTGYAIAAMPKSVLAETRAFLEPHGFDVTAYTLRRVPDGLSHIPVFAPERVAAPAPAAATAVAAQDKSLRVLAIAAMAAVAVGVGVGFWAETRGPAQPSPQLDIAQVALPPGGRLDIDPRLPARPASRAQQPDIGPSGATAAAADTAPGVPPGGDAASALVAMGAPAAPALSTRPDLPAVSGAANRSSAPGAFALRDSAPNWPAIFSGRVRESVAALSAPAAPAAQPLRPGAETRIGRADTGLTPLSTANAAALAPDLSTLRALARGPVIVGAAAQTAPERLNEGTLPAALPAVLPPRTPRGATVDLGPPQARPQAPDLSIFFRDVGPVEARVIAPRQGAAPQGRPIDLTRPALAPRPQPSTAQAQAQLRLLFDPAGPTSPDLAALRGAQPGAVVARFSDPARTLAGPGTPALDLAGLRAWGAARSLRDRAPASEGLSAEAEARVAALPATSALDAPQPRAAIADPGAARRQPDAAGGDTDPLTGLALYDITALRVTAARPEIVPPARPADLPDQTPPASVARAIAALPDLLRPEIATATAPSIDTRSREPAAENPWALLASPGPVLVQPSDQVAALIEGVLSDAAQGPVVPTGPVIAPPPARPEAMVAAERARIAAEEERLAALQPSERALRASTAPPARPAGLNAAAPPPPPLPPTGTTAVATQPPVTAEPTRPQRVIPTIPTTASVARAATIQDAMPMRDMVLIGVYGTATNRHALLRLGNGNFVKVSPGDQVGGFSVAAISADAIRLRQRGRERLLVIPE